MKEKSPIEKYLVHGENVLQSWLFKAKGDKTAVIATNQRVFIDGPAFERKEGFLTSSKRQIIRDISYDHIISIEYEQTSKTHWWLILISIVLLLFSVGLNVRLGSALNWFLGLCAMFGLVYARKTWQG